MHHPILLPTLATALLATAAASQMSIWVPNGYESVASNSATGSPWSRSTPTRYQQIYSASHFLGQGVTFPWSISRVRFRPYSYGIPWSWNGGSWPNAVIKMSTAATTYLTPFSSYAANHGPNLTTVHAGPLTVLPGATTGLTSPNPAHIDINFSTPFLYDPAGGDLCLEVILDTAAVGSMQCEAVGSLNLVGWPALGTSIRTDNNHTATTGAVVLNYALVAEFTGLPATGYAYKVPYGAGCYQEARASVYQYFPPGTFNRSVTGLRMLPTGTGYQVVPGTSPWRNPTGPSLSFANGVSGPQPLGFTFNYPGGSTTQVFVAVKGFAWMQPNTDGQYPSPRELLGLAARFCPLATELSVNIGGARIVFEVDQPNQVAYVSWINVGEPFGTVPLYNPNTFQIAFHASGIVDMRWQSCAVTQHYALTGWSPGGNALDPGSRNLTTGLPIVTSPDLRPITLSVFGRPILGTSVGLVTGNIPAGTPVGASILSFTQHVPGLDLQGIGMPGCSQYVGLDGCSLFAPSGSSTILPLLVPNLASLAGMRVFSQSATFSAGLNPLGVLASNGLTLVVGAL